MFLKIMHEKKTNLQQQCSKKQEKQGFLSKRTFFFATSVQQQNDNVLYQTRKEDRYKKIKKRNVKKR